MRAAPRSDHRMNLVDDHGANGAQHCAAPLGRQQQIERLRRRDEDVRRRAQHRRPLAAGRIAGANRGHDARRLEPHLFRDPANAGPRLREVLVNVGAQRLERRDVDHPHFVGQRPAQTLFEQIVERVQKRREGLSGSGRRRDQRVPPLANRRPPSALRGSRLAQRFREPAANGGMEVRKGHGGHGWGVGPVFTYARGE